MTMKKILYFVRGVPTEAELLAAQANYALIRDYTAWHEGDCLEMCDMVIGKYENIPGPYKHLWQGESKQSESELENVQSVAARGRKSGKASNTSE